MSSPWSVKCPSGKRDIDAMVVKAPDVQQRTLGKGGMVVALRKTDLLVEAGVTAILNFVPAQLTVPDSVKLQNVDPSVLLKTLTYHIT